MLGRNPVNELSAKSIFASIEALERLGITPLRSVASIRRNCRFGSPRPMFVGRLPDSGLKESDISLIVEILKIEDGMRPLRLLSWSSKLCKFGRSPISSGIVPATISQTLALALVEKNIDLDRNGNFNLFYYIMAFKLLPPTAKDSKF